MLTLYGYKQSGNSYKPRLVCALLDIDYQWVEVNTVAGENKDSDFLLINPLGQVPVLKIDASDSNSVESSRSDFRGIYASTLLLESNAIMCYLATDSWLIPSDPIRYAQMWQWLLYEQNEVRANIAPIRVIKKRQNMIASRLEEYQQKFIKAQEVLSHLDQQLAHQPFILGEDISLSDIGLYAYSHVADEGGIELSAYPNLKSWFKRIESLDNYAVL